MNGRHVGSMLVFVSAILVAAPASADETPSDPIVQLMEGQGLEQRGLLVEAREAMLASSRMPVAPNESAIYAEAREKARAHASDLDWRIPRARLHVVGRAMDELTVLVDGRIIDRAALATSLRLNPGEHMFVARTSDGGERHVTFVLAEGETRSVRLDFAADTVVSATPPRAVVDTKSETTISPLVFGGFAFAAVGLGVGIGAGILSMNKTDELKTSCVNAMCPASVRGDIDDAKTYSTISTIGFVTGAVGASVGIVGLLIGSKKETPTKREASSARVLVGPASVGLAGSF